MPPLAFVAATGPHSALVLTRAGACCAERSWAPLWTPDSVAAKRLLNSIQSQTGSSTPARSTFVTQIVRQTVDPESKTFILWTKRSPLDPVNSLLSSPTTLFISSICAAYLLNKVVVESLYDGTSLIIPFLYAALKTISFSSKGQPEFNLSAPILADILSRVEHAEDSNLLKSFLGYAKCAIAEVAATIQRLACNEALTDDSIIRYSSVFNSPIDIPTSPSLLQILNISQVQALLSCLVSCTHKLVQGASITAEFEILVRAFHEMILQSTPHEAFSSDVEKELSTEPILFVPYGLPVAECDDKAFSMKHMFQIEAMSPWNVLFYQHNETVLVHKLRQGTATDCFVLNNLHLAGIPNSHGETALMMAIKMGRSEFISTLVPLEAGYVDLLGNTASMLILSSGNTSLLQQITNLLYYERSALQRCGFNDLMFEVFIKPYRTPTNLHLAKKQTIHGYTALMFAVIIDNLLAVAALAPLEACIRTKKFKQAGTIALEMRRMDCIDILLEYEDIRDSLSNTALHRKVMEPQARLSSEELDRYRHMLGRYNVHGRTALMEAALSHNIEAVQALLEWEGNMTTPKTMTISFVPSRGAEQREHPVVELTEVTAFMLCLREFSPINPVDNEILQILSEKEGSTACTNKITPLMLLAILNKPYFYHLCKSSIGKTDSKGKTALMYATEYAAYEIAMLLVDHEAGVHDTSGYTALLYLVRDNQTINAELITALARREGQLVNLWNWSALTYAVHNNNTAVAKLLCAFSTSEQIVQARSYAQIRSKSTKVFSADLLAILNVV